MLTTNKSNRGFTIVELLIVIVVIGILAAIAMVAYTGVQNRAKTTKAMSVAKEVGSKIDIYASENEGNLPAAASALNTVNETWTLSPEAQEAVDQTGGVADGKVQIRLCNSGAGYMVGYYDFQKKGVASDDDVIKGADSGGCKWSEATPLAG